MHLKHMGSSNFFLRGFCENIRNAPIYAEEGHILYSRRSLPQRSCACINQDEHHCLYATQYKT